MSFKRSVVSGMLLGIVLACGMGTSTALALPTGSTTAAQTSAYGASLFEGWDGGHGVIQASWVDASTIRLGLLDDVQGLLGEAYLDIEDVSVSGDAGAEAFLVRGTALGSTGQQVHGLFRIDVGTLAVRAAEPADKVDCNLCKKIYGDNPNWDKSLQDLFDQREKYLRWWERDLARCGNNAECIRQVNLQWESVVASVDRMIAFLRQCKSSCYRTPTPQ
jgi:hypothetical protein